MPKGISIKCVRHLPATIGIMLGILLRLPTFWVLQLGEIFALTFYIGICSKALSLTPVNKEIFEIIMLLPMCIQQAALINYDAVLLPLCFLLIAYIFHIKFRVNEVVDLKNIIYIAGILLIIAIVKLPYIVLGGIFFIIPLDKVRIRLGTQYVFTIRACIRNRIIILTSIVAIVCTSLFVLKANEYVRLFLATVIEASRTKNLMKTTLETLFGEYNWSIWLVRYAAPYVLCLLIGSYYSSFFYFKYIQRK